MGFSKIAEELILSVAKEDGLKLAKLLKRTGKIDEFTLAGKFGREVNYVRSLLYSLYEYKIVSYSRKRDPEKMWWIYYWEIDEDRINELLAKNIADEISRLEKQKERMTDDQIFECKECGRVFDFESSADQDFKCPACQKTLEYVDSSFILEEVEEKLEEKKQLLEKIMKKVSKKERKEEKDQSKEYKSMKKSEIYNLAQKYNVPGRSGMTKAELIKAIERYDSEE